MNAIEVVNATKIYRRFGHKRQFATLKSALLGGSLIRDLRPDETFTAVRDVSFTVPAGCTLGVIGRNGSGKSTMLKLVAGITKPTTGTVHVNGRISALIELGAGFHPEISGRENVFINGIMLGLSKREVARRFDEIVEFAELEEFIDAPVKTYSSGMYMRLGFAVAIHVDPDVLLVDEVLAVGDEGFTHKCLDKFAEFKRRGKTILLVTHALSMVERFCDEALWLDGGAKKGIGDPKRIVDAYITAVERGEEVLLAAGDARAQELTVPISPDEPAAALLPDHPVESGTAPANMFLAAEGRWGSREVEITDVMLSSADGARAHVFHSGDRLDIRLRLHAPLPIEDFVVGLGLFNAEGVCCYGTNTNVEEYKSELLHGDGEVTITIDNLDLVEGTYKLDVAVHRVDGYPYDYHRLLYTFRVKSRTKDVGIYRPRHSWRFSDGIKLSRESGSTAVKLEATGRVLSRSDAAAFAQQLRNAGKQVVFTNGVFDLIHPGHVRYLGEARALGDALIVGVNADASVRRNKGERRPVTPEDERAELISALACVDAVTVFAEDTPAEVIRAIQPDVLVKGADWAADQIVGRDTVEARGGRVVRIAVEEGHSTSALLKKIRAR